MPFIPSSPVQTTTWTNSPTGTGNTWSNDTVPDVFDVLADIDGNLIVDTAGTYIGLFGGFTTDTASQGATMTPDNAGTAVTWTAEG